MAPILVCSQREHSSIHTCLSALSTIWLLCIKHLLASISLYSVKMALFISWLDAWHIGTIMSSNSDECDNCNVKTIMAQICVETLLFQPSRKWQIWLEQLTSVHQSLCVSKSIEMKKFQMTRDGVVGQLAELTARIIVGANHRCDWNYHGNGLNSSKTRATSMWQKYNLAQVVCRRPWFC